MKKVHSPSPAKKGGAGRKNLAIAAGSFAMICVLQNYLKRAAQIIL